MQQNHISYRFIFTVLLLLCSLATNAQNKFKPIIKAVTEILPNKVKLPPVPKPLPPISPVPVIKGTMLGIPPQHSNPLPLAKWDIPASNSIIHNTHIVSPDTYDIRKNRSHSLSPSITPQSEPLERLLNIDLIQLEELLRPIDLDLQKFDPDIFDDPFDLDVAIILFLSNDYLKACYYA